MQTWAIVVAAGSGARFGAAKQFATIGAERLGDRAVKAATRCCDGVVVVLPGGETWTGPPVAAAVAGGSTRAASVRAGLGAVPADAEIVVVHDAARPLAGDELFVAVIGAIVAGADGAVPGLAVSDTIKRVENRQVIATVPREGLVTVQTPQAFRAASLRAAHADGGEGTDDAALVEAVGGSVVVVAGDPTNMKVTGPQDLMLATTLMSRKPGA